MGKHNYQKCIHQIKNKLYDSREFLSLLILSAVAITLILAIILTMAYGTPKARKENAALLADIQTKDLKSCILTSSSSSFLYGHFVLGCGGVYSSTGMDIEYYFYMYGKTGYGLEKLNANYVEIVPINEGIPYIEGHFDKNEDLYKYGNLPRYLTEQQRYELMHYTLYLPEEYIVAEYDINIGNIE